MEGRVVRRRWWRRSVRLVVVFVVGSSESALAAPSPGPTSRGEAKTAETGSVRGRVVEQGGAPIAGAQVVVVGTRLGAIAGTDGAFVILGVTAGTVQVRAIRIGYTPSLQTVVVADGAEATANFTLERSVLQLEAVITTATGEQSRRSVGNVVASVRIDSIAAQQPLTSVNDALTARTAGVQVQLGSGQTGTAPSIRIRGVNSLSLSNEPLIIIDGVRADNSAAPGNFSTQRLNRFAAFNPEDVESIDIIKGPSAAALYGTAAANGVIVIKTKRGRAGRTDWRVNFENGRVLQPATFRDNYRSWGRNLTGGVPGTAAVLCRVSDASLGRCRIDSLTTFNPLENPETTPFKTQPRNNYGLSASGGSDKLRFFLSGDREDETGPYEMPAAEIARLTTLRGARPRPGQIHPNRLGQASLRGNFNLALRDNMEMGISSAYSDRKLNSLFDGGFFAGLSFQSYFAPGFRTATGGTSAQNIGDIMSVEQIQRDQRTVLSSTYSWQPLSWLQTRAVAGMDQNQGYSTRFARFGEGTITGWGPPGQTGGKDVNRNNFSRYSLDLGANATWVPVADVELRTAVGAQWFKDAQYQTVGRGYSIPPGTTTPNAGAVQLSQEFTEENAFYGAFFEEQIAHRDRLFLKLQVRTDQASAFGRNAGNTIYPGASLSYVISDEGWFPKGKLGVSNLRLRTAYGRAGVQPATTAAIQFLSAFTAPVGGAEQPALRLSNIGNADLKPEVTSETEFGFDLGLFGNRVNVEATYFQKESRDALFFNPIAPSIGQQQAGVWQNLAKVRNWGQELTISGDIVRNRVWSWSTQLNGSHIKNELVDAGTATLAVTPGGRNVEGYPLFGLWDRKITRIADANGDGIITEAEIDISATDEYKGPTAPVWEAGISNNFGFFRDKLRVTTVFDYRGGFYNQWGFENQRCVSGNCQAANDPKAPLADQAAAVTTNSAAKRTVWGFFVPNDFMRFRELSVSYSMPQSIARLVRSQSASLVFAGRNIGLLHNKYPGIDPEMNSAAANTAGSNNDFFAAPPLRYWLARINLGF